MGQKYGCEPEGLLPLCPKGRSGLAAIEKGGIINIAYRGNPRLAGLSDSCVSEDGVIIFTKVLAADLGPSGIGVNSIAPGLTVEKSAKLLGEVLRSASRSRRSLPFITSARPIEF